MIKRAGRWRIRLSRTLAVGFAGCLVFAACIFESQDSNPFQGLSCQEKIDKMAREINAFAKNQPSAAKISVSDSDGANSARPSIQLFRGYPPVIQADSSTHPSLQGGVPVIETDSGTASSQVLWIPPVGFSDITGKGSLVEPDSLGSAMPETTKPVPLPENVSTIMIISGGAYRSHVRILDYKRDLVGEFDQDFGYRGELVNVNRIVRGGRVSYLVWKYTDADGHRPDDGLYIWQIRIKFASNKVVDTTAMTGLLDPACVNTP